MTVSEWKIANSVIVDDENYDVLNATQTLYSGAEITKGSRFMDAILEVEEFGQQTVYLLDSEIGLFNIVNDPEWDDMLPTAQQKFTVTPKA